MQKMLLWSAVFYSFFLSSGAWAQGGLFDGVGESMIIGAIVGAGIGVIIVVIRAIKTKQSGKSADKADSPENAPENFSKSEDDK